MDAVRQWAFSLCSAVVAAAIARMALPESSLQKMFHVTLSVFILCGLLSPLVLKNPQLRVWAEEYSVREIEQRAAALEQAALEQSQKQAAASLEKIVAQNLDEMGINFRYITINISMNGQHAPQIQEVALGLAPSYEANGGEICTALENRLGVAVRPEFENGG